MGFAPPPDGPPPGVQAALSASASFQPSLPAISLCGFTLPSFLFAIEFSLLIEIFPLQLPSFSFSLGFACDLNNPISIGIGLDFGGGRVATYDPNPDDDLAAFFDQAA